MSITTAVIGTFFALLVCISVVLSLYFWFRRRRYTRERFAFFIFSSCVTLTFAAIATIAVMLPSWQQVLVLVHYFRTGEMLPTFIPSLASARIIVALFGIISLPI
ncbi:MAG: hypothetical protein D3924_10255 [Candidatus Electrothrix sp. AR4]|nr:hypothetical protein [Candidatus Electrothrix sp. AR4]